MKERKEDEKKYVLVKVFNKYIYFIYMDINNERSHQGHKILFMHFHKCLFVLNVNKQASSICSHNEQLHSVLYNNFWHNNGGENWMYRKVTTTTTKSSSNEQKTQHKTASGTFCINTYTTYIFLSQSFPFYLTFLRMFCCCYYYFYYYCCWWLLLFAAMKKLSNIPLCDLDNIFFIAQKLLNKDVNTNKIYIFYICFYIFMIHSMHKYFGMVCCLVIFNIKFPLAFFVSEQFFKTMFQESIFDWLK